MFSNFVQAQKKAPALVSIHDVAPENFFRVKQMVEFFQRFEIYDVCLLIIPDREWKPDQISYLNSLTRKGCRLAGHGWTHKCSTPKKAFHRLHAAFFSRDVAEHYSCENTTQIKKLIEKCYWWFENVGLGAPDVYVPPAWGMGGMSWEEFQELPFRWYEFLTGIFDSWTNRFYRLPLVGFEADTFFRAMFLLIFNWMNLLFSEACGIPYRIALHPHDLELKMRSPALNLLASQKRCI